MKAEHASDTARFEGTLGAPLPQSLDPNDRKSVTFPVQTSGTDTTARRVLLSADCFRTATYVSYDGVDYFMLRMCFDDGSTVTVVDANAPTI